jgi:hypothetical protein
MRQLFRRSPRDTHTEGEFWWVPNPRSNDEMWTLPARRLVQGHAGSRTVRVVCKNCNNGWISAIDEAAKTILLPLICDHAVTIDLNHQIALATFLTKIVITSEYSKATNRTVPKGTKGTVLRKQKSIATLAYLDRTVQRLFMERADDFSSYGQIVRSHGKGDRRTVEHAFDNNWHGISLGSDHRDKP